LGLLSEYRGTNIVNIWRSLEKISRYMSPKQVWNLKTKSVLILINFCDLFHMFIKLFMLELVCCVSLCHYEPVDLMTVRYMFTPNHTLPSNRHHRSNGDCLQGKRGNYQACCLQYCAQQLCTVQCIFVCVLLCVHCMHVYCVLL